MVEALDATPVDGAENATVPFFSADGQALGFWSSGGLHRVPAAGGESEVLASPDRASGVKALRLPDVLPGGEAVLVTVADLDIDSFGCRSYIYNSINYLQAHYRWYVTHCL